MTKPERSPITGIHRVKLERAARIIEAGHDPISGTIEVKFTTGAVWQYQSGFDSYTFESFVRADDQQSFFDRHIYGRQHAQRHICVTQDEANDPRAVPDDPRTMAY